MNDKDDGIMVAFGNIGKESKDSFDKAIEKKINKIVEISLPPNRCGPCPECGTVNRRPGSGLVACRKCGKIYKVRDVE